MTKTMVNMPELLKRFHEEYSFLYDSRDRVAGYFDDVNAFDEGLESARFRNLVEDFIEYRRDFISSDREAAAFIRALNSLQIEV